MDILATLTPTSKTSFVLLLFAAVCFVFGLFFLKNLYLSRLHTVPGPRRAAASGLWLWVQDLTGRAPKTIRQLHAEYCMSLCLAFLSPLKLYRDNSQSIPGAIVRIGPNEISINDVDVYNDVLYRQAPSFLKVCP
jgi:hypothetical protein